MNPIEFLDARYTEEEEDLRHRAARRRLRRRTQQNIERRLDSLKRRRMGLAWCSVYPSMTHALRFLLEPYQQHPDFDLTWLES